MASGAATSPPAPKCDASGKQKGAGPTTPSRRTPLWATAKKSYVAQDSRQLSISVGDVIEVLDRDTTGWWGGRLCGKVGWFPACAVRVISAATSPSATPVAVVDESAQGSSIPCIRPRQGSSGSTSPRPAASTTTSPPSAGTAVVSPPSAAQAASRAPSFGAHGIHTHSVSKKTPIISRPALRKSARSSRSSADTPNFGVSHLDNDKAQQTTADSSAIRDRFPVQPSAPGDEIVQLRETISRLETQVTELTHDKSQLQADKKELAQEIARGREERGQLQQRITEQEALISRLRRRAKAESFIPTCPRTPATSPTPNRIRPPTQSPLRAPTAGSTPVSPSAAPTPAPATAVSCAATPTDVSAAPPTASPTPSPSPSAALPPTCPKPLPITASSRSPTSKLVPSGLRSPSGAASPGIRGTPAGGRFASSTMISRPRASSQGVSVLSLVKRFESPAPGAPATTAAPTAQDKRETTSAVAPPAAVATFGTSALNAEGNSALPPPSSCGANNAVYEAAEEVGDEPN